MPTARYALAVVLAAGAAAAHGWLQAELVNAPFLLHYPTAFLAAWICGFGPALIAIAGGVGSALAFSGASSLSPHALPLWGFIALTTPISWLVSRGNRWHRRTFMELDAKQRQMEAVLSQMPVGIIIAKAPSGEILTGNEHAERIVGRPVSASGQDSFTSFMSSFSYHADNSPYLPDHCPLARSLRQEETITSEEMFILRGDGECRTLSAYSTPIKDARGRVFAGVMAFFDISHQKRVERALRESEEGYRLAIEGSNGGDWEIPVDAQGRFQDAIRISPALKGFIGFGASEFPDRLSAWQERIHPDDLVEVRKRAEAHARREVPYHQVEYRIRHRDGSWRWIASIGRLFHAPDGRPARWMGIDWDITETKAAESQLKLSQENLREREALLRQALDAAQLGTFELWVQTGQTKWSEQTKRHFGFPTDATADFDLFTSAIHPDDRLRVLGNIREAMKPQTGGKYEHEYRIIRLNDQQERWLATRGQVHFDDQGKPLRVIGVSMDITERKRVEEDLLRTLRHLDLGSSFVRGIDDRIITWTKGCTRLYGYTAAQAIGRKAKELLKTRFSVPFELVQQQLADSGYWGGELQHTTADGRNLTISSEWVLYRNRKGQPAAILQTNVDITERKKAEEELQRAIRVRNDIMAVISHDLKNPLSAIDLNATMLQKAAGTALRPDFVLGRTRTIKQAAQRALRLIADLLDISRIESGHFQIHPAECDPPSLFRGPLDELRSAAEHKGVRLLDQVGLSEEKVVCDHDRISQVISNIVGNAIKFVPDRGGKIRITAEATEDAVVFAIMDNGTGIKAEDLPHIFDRFWHAQHSKKAGAGLGLSIARGIVQAHGGKIWVESQEGHGTCFYFTIPKAMSPRGKQLLAQAAQAPTRHQAA